MILRTGEKATQLAATSKGVGPGGLVSLRLGLLLLGALSGAAFAQLDQDCTVSIMNRNAPATPDRTWRVVNEERERVFL